eukprot:scaffold650_cov407-Prasinococcus_capsulatus_cf.AAC.11
MAGKVVYSNRWLRTDMFKIEERVGAQVKMNFGDMYGVTGMEGLRRGPQVGCVATKQTLMAVTP